VRELDFSRIWLRINAADDSEKEDIVAEFRCDTKDFLEQCLVSISVSVPWPRQDKYLVVGRQAGYANEVPERPRRLPVIPGGWIEQDGDQDEREVCADRHQA
jgi:hypothetical protein